MQLLAPHVFDVYIRDLQLPARRWLQVPGNRHHAVIENVEAGHSVVAPGLCGLLLNRNRLALAIELHHAIPFRVVDVISEDRRAPLEVREGPVKAVAAVENIVAENQRDGVLAYEAFGNEKRLGDALRLGLLAVINRESPDRKSTRLN